MTNVVRPPARATSLVEELDTLREEVRQLRALLRPVVAFPVCLRLTPLEHHLLSALVAVGTGYASHARLMAALDGCFKEGGPDYHAIAVYVSRLRRKLRPYGVAIENMGPLGWRIVPGGIPILEAMVAVEVGRR